MIICTDIDNCLNDLMYKSLVMYNSMTNKNIQLSDITAYNLSECLSQMDAKGITKLFKSKELWDSLIPLKDAQWGIETLIKTGHRVVFATATDPINFNWKIDWFKKHFPFVDTEDIIRVTDKSLIRCDVMIEDNLDQLNRSMCDRICLDYPWNQSKEKDFVYDILRAHSWKDIIKFINKIEKENEKWEK